MGVTNQRVIEVASRQAFYVEIRIPFRVATIAFPIGQACSHAEKCRHIARGINVAGSTDQSVRSGTSDQNVGAVVPGQCQCITNEGIIACATVEDVIIDVAEQDIIKSAARQILNIEILVPPRIPGVT